MALSRRDFKERLRFVRFWADYVKKTPNKEWSRQQNILINSVLKSANQNVELYLRIKRTLGSRAESRSYPQRIMGSPGFILEG
jgi:hypothetical protein